MENLIIEIYNIISSNSDNESKLNQITIILKAYGLDKVLAFEERERIGIEEISKCGFSYNDE